MKLFITLFILTLSCVSVGQTKMTLYLKDGTIKNGYGKRKNQDIIFSNTKK